MSERITEEQIKRLRVLLGKYEQASDETPVGRMHSPKYECWKEIKMRAAQALPALLDELEALRVVVAEFKQAEPLYDLPDSFRTLVEWATEDQSAPDDIRICLGNIAHALDHITKAAEAAGRGGAG